MNDFLSSAFPVIIISFIGLVLWAIFKDDK